MNPIISLCLVTIIGSVFVIPFLVSVITDPESFNKDEKWSLIFLGMATSGWTVTVFSIFSIVEFLNKTEIRSEPKEK